MQGRHRNAGPLSERGVVNSMQGSQHSAGPPSVQCRGRLSMQGRLLNAGPSTQRSAVVSTGSVVTSIAGRRLSIQGLSHARSATPSAQCSRPLNASGRRQLAGPCVSMQGCSFQCRSVCFNAGLSLQDHQCSAGSSAQRRADTSMQERLVGLTMIF